MREIDFTGRCIFRHSSIGCHLQSNPGASKAEGTPRNVEGKIAPQTVAHEQIREADESSVAINSEERNLFRGTAGTARSEKVAKRLERRVASPPPD